MSFCILYFISSPIALGITFSLCFSLLGILIFLTNSTGTISNKTEVTIALGLIGLFVAVNLLLYRTSLSEATDYI